MLGSNNGPLEAKFPAHNRVEPQLFPEPDGHRLEERSEPTRRIGQIGLDQPVHLEGRLFVETDDVDLARIRAHAPQARGDGLPRESCVVLDPRKPLLLCRGDHLAVAHEACGAVVIKGRNSQNQHSSCLQFRIPLKRMCIYRDTQSIVCH